MKKLLQLNPLTIALTAFTVLSIINYFLLGVDDESTIGPKMVMGLIAVVIILVNKFDHFVGLTRQVSDWHPRWMLYSVPLLSLVFYNLSRAHYSSLEIDFKRIPFLLIDNFSVGFFEELLLRGLLFYVLYRLWGSTRAGIFLACLAQSLAFGLLHYINLDTYSAALVNFQVLYATAIGFGFGALMLITRSIWPSIIIHFLIDAASCIDEYFYPQYSAEIFDISPREMLIATALICIPCVLPSLFYIQNHFSNKNKSVSL